MIKLKKFIPFLVLFALLGLLARELFYSKPNELPSALLGETLPNFELPSLLNAEKKLTQTNFYRPGQVSLLNVWATWCSACYLEHPMLMKIHQHYHLPIYSINYKDNPDEAKKWLKKFGNPYVLTGSDAHGNVAIDLGVYGTPETFIISPQGKIIYRHVGAIDQKIWDDTLYPIIERYRTN